MKFKLFLLIFNLFILPLFCFKMTGMKNKRLNKKLIFEQNKVNTPKYSEEWFDNVPIDHYSYLNSKTFKLRYLINIDYFKQKNAPIFIVLGDEGTIEDDPPAYGFVYDIAPLFGAAIIFAEHRFFGKTLPFGNNSYLNVENMGYLSPEQAMGDYALLIKYLKEQRLSNANKSPVIAFGGSYAGMLVAWMRVKFPHLVDGGIAASAPVRYFENVPFTIDSSYHDIIAKDFLYYGCTTQMILKTFDAIRQLANTSEGRKFLNENYKLSPLSQINVPSDSEHLINAFTSIMDFMAMWNYNYYYIPYPVNVSCQGFVSAKTSEQIALALLPTFNLIYVKTNNTFQLWNWDDDEMEEDSDRYGWNWLICTELVFTNCSRGPPFVVFDKTCPFNEKDNLKYCLENFSKFGYNEALFRPNWATTNYGYDFTTATNLVFTNGIFDPWSGGGWRQTTTNVGSVYSYITDGGHCYDIRRARADDTQSIKDIRRLETIHIGEWIHQAKFKITNSTDGE
ncbi:hypothetical protein Mgra_00007598 [Meloidogyne graminicola]|uniref:Uncharacterized protein n=1 Tax=Meloidogyne graminicola TaxID=189291 RepID=A0A8S9ZIB1_9BILA|nr:hypothetical protein Mgra_00007598 [Meloidogyne graminicola]